MSNVNKMKIMKTVKMLLVAMLFIIGSLTNESAAQNTLRALMKKCETIDNIDVNVVRQKNKETLKVTQIITTVQIPASDKMVDEFIAAFEKDEPSAYQVISSKKNGRIVPQYYKFNNVSFSFSYKTDDFYFSSGKDGKKKKNEEMVNITMIEDSFN